MKPLGRFIRSRSVIASVALALLVAPTLAPAQLPTLGDSSDMTSSAERKLGEKIAAELYRDPDYIDDPVIDEYVLEIWSRLMTAARARGELSPELDERFAWRVLVGKDRTINAFALPGGWLGLHLGLVSVTATRDELASVLAHELSHVTQRHISRMMTQQSQQAPLLMAALILSAIAASKNPDMGQALIVGSQALAVQQGLNFSRDMEREADRIGMGIAMQAGFEPQGFVGMFEKLQQASRLNDNGSFPYLRTHPMNIERIADMRSRLPEKARAPAPEPDLIHAIMVGRSRVMSNPGVDALRGLVAESESASFAASSRARQVGGLYAAALAHSKLRDSQAASRVATRLATVVAGDKAAMRHVRLLTAEIAFQAGDAARAAQQLDGAAPGRPELILASQAQVLSGRAAEAAQKLQTWVAMHPKDAQAWQVLATAQTAIGQTLRAIRAEAESRVAHLDYKAAMDRFRSAQEIARRGGVDHIDASIIDSRARQVESLLREQALER